MACTDLVFLATADPSFERFSLTGSFRPRTKVLLSVSHCVWGCGTSTVGVLSAF